MNRGALLTLWVIATLPFCRVHAEDYVHGKGNHEFLYGVKISASSAATNPYKIAVGSIGLKEYRIDSQVGTSLMLNGGVGFGQFRILSGIGLDYSRSTIYVDFNSFEGSNLQADEGCLSVEMKDLMIPLKLDYTLIDQEPYRLSVFAGPKARLVLPGSYDSDFQQFPAEGLKEEPSTLMMSGAIGIGVQTGRTFFEFELEHSFSNLSDGIMDRNGHPSGIVIDRKLNIMTFSVGILL